MRLPAIARALLIQAHVLSSPLLHLLQISNTLAAGASVMAIGASTLAGGNALGSLGQRVQGTATKVDEVKAELGGMEGRLKAELGGMEGRLKAELGAVEGRLQARLNGIQAQLGDMQMQQGRIEGGLAVAAVAGILAWWSGSRNGRRD